MDVYRVRLLKLLCTVLPILFFGCSPPVQPQTNTVAIEPVLEALQPSVQVTSPNQSPVVLQQNQSLPVALDDLMTADNQGHGIMRLEDRLTVDLFRESEFRVTQIKQEAGNSMTIEIEHLKGHIRVQLSDQANARVRLTTSMATVTTLRAGTDYIICHNPVKLSCIVVLKGEVEVVGQGKVVTLKGGEATYVLKGKEPFPPICSHPEEVVDWVNKKSGTQEVPAISALVSSWPQEPCSAATQKAAVTPGPSLPSAQGMVKIPAGQYTVGVGAPNENQVLSQYITLQQYWIDRYEVTNAQYKVFVNQTGHAPPTVWPGDDQKPVAGVTFEDAAAYCSWAGKRLPTEAEWEAAARGPGPEPPLFPWGNDPLAGGKIDDLPLDTTYPVGSYSFNQSPFGVFDMAGNVWEWVDKPYAPVQEYTRVLRGGRYGFLQNMAHREQVEPNDARFVSVAGFRCVADQVEGK